MEPVIIFLEKEIPFGSHHYSCEPCYISGCKYLLIGPFSKIFFCQQTQKRFWQVDKLMEKLNRLVGLTKAVDPEWMDGWMDGWDLSTV